MEDVEVAFLIALSIIVVLITSIWWATRTKKRQAESTKPVKIPLPQDDLRAARNRYYQQQGSDQQLSEREPIQTDTKQPDSNETELTELIESTSKADERGRMYSFATLRNTWASKEQETSPTVTENDPAEATDYTTNVPSVTDSLEPTVSSVPDEMDDLNARGGRPRNRDTISQIQFINAPKPAARSAAHKVVVKDPSQHSSCSTMEESEVKVMQGKRSSLLIQHIRQKMIHYKYESLPRAKLPNIGYDESGHPVIQPIKSFYKLLSWLPGFDNFNVPCVPLRRRGNTKPNVKILLCHDMMGGYTLDKFPQGVGVTKDYHFYHWHMIEAFVYFSHNFITIPPPTWTNAAHGNGVLSLGTVITEWEEGAQTCNLMLSSISNIEKFVEQCVNLATYYQFDGWLVNIENNLQPDQVDKLLQLVKSLTEAMHASKPWSQVIWYDSVITNGQLKWQNALNQLNQPFFDACDGIFLNYSWNDWMLASSKSLVGDMRATDVYVGIDVFGRGCFGGGGYNSVAALKMARKHGLSAAIFAPGWVFETQSKESFIRNQNKFWSLLAPHCECRIVDGLPMVASFCRGFGDLVAVDGKVVHSGSWTNHSAQDIQLSFDKEMFELGVKGSLFISAVDITTEMAYNNGSSLNVVGKVFKYGVSSRTIIRLLMMEANFNKPLLIAYTYSLATPGSLLHSLQLHTNKAPRYVILDPFASPQVDDDTAPPDAVNQQLLTKYGIIRSHGYQVPGMSGIDQSNYVCFAPLPISYSQLIHKKFTGSEELTTGQWTTSYFFITSKELSTASVREVRLVCEPPSDSAAEDNAFSLNVGEIKVLNPRCIGFDYVHATVSHLSCCDVLCSQKDRTLSATLHWQLHQNNPIDPTLQYNIYHQFDHDEATILFTGRAFSTFYRVTDLKLTDAFARQEHCKLVFYIQSVSQSGRKSEILDCPSLAMNWD